MPKVSKNIYGKYDREKLSKAVEAVANGMSCSGAAWQFGIPRMTLADHVAGRSKLERKAGRTRNVPEKIEDEIVDKAIASAEAGFPITKQQFLLKVGAVVKKLGLKTQFKDGLPGKDYWLQLKKRRPDLVIRVPENCGSNRLQMMRREVVDNYFRDLEMTMNGIGLQDKPSQIWNCDETGLQFCPNAAKVLAPKGVKSLVARCSPSKESITTLVCVNAEGSAMPPMYVVKGKTNRSIHSFAIQDSPEGTIWAVQENGWMNDEIGVQWFREVFFPNCGNARPQLLVLDSHHSHEVLDTLELARQENIIIIALPPHTTHMLQPLDRVVFKPFKTAYRRHCTEFLAANPGKTINKVTWPGLLKKTWESTLKPNLIMESFEATGIHPISRTRIPESAFLPGEAYRAATSHMPTNTESISEPVPSSSTMMQDDDILTISLEDLRCMDFTNMTITVEGDEVHIDDLVGESINLGPDEARACGAMEISPPLTSTTAVPSPTPEANWNQAINEIFDITPQQNPSELQQRRSRAIPSHRLLTSEQVLQEKREAAEKEERKEQEKKARKERAEQKKKEKAAKNAN